MLLEVSGQKVKLETSGLPEFTDYSFGSDYWLNGRKYITYLKDEVLHMSVFCADIPHAVMAVDVMGDDGSDRVLSAGFTRIEDGELEAYGYSTSLKPCRVSERRDTIILLAVVEHLAEKTETIKFR